MNKEFQLNSIDMATFFIQATISLRLVMLPREIVRYAGTDSWISLLLGSSVVLVVSYMLWWLGVKFPGKNGSEIVRLVFGKFVGSMGLIAIAIHTIVSLAFGLRIFAGSIRIYLLPSTPEVIVIGVMLIISVYAVTKGLKTITTLINILLPQVLFFTIFMLILPYKRAEPQNIYPLFHSGIMDIVKGTLEVVDALYGFTIIAYIMPYFKEPRETKKWIFGGWIITTSIYLGLLLMCIMVLGAEEILWLVHPVLSLVKSILLKVSIVERAESFLMIGWVISVFIMICLSFFVSYENLKVLFGVRKLNLFIYGQILFIVGIAFSPQNTAQVQIYSQYIHYLGRVIMLVMVPMTVGLVLLKGRKKKHAL
ncbi:GerAB/ArcD/ProY family transporter [Anaerosolibacter sp.]|uniref:GerAB/ArcD/ProY family transporter n=1 Tax=Anaerosolibacter sp. TaxID=1872527 RepID=UPI0039EF3B91